MIFHALTKSSCAGIVLMLAANLPLAAQETRSVTDALGRSVEIPGDIERISVLDAFSSLEALLALGIAPTQISQRDFVKEYLGDPLLQWPWLEAALKDIGADPERIVQDSGPEFILSSEPDLIVGATDSVEPVLKQLEAIAPTIAVAGGDVRATLTLYGEVFGLEDKAREVLAAWDKRIETELKPLTPEGATIAVIRVDDPGSFAVIHSVANGIYSYFDLAGYTTPPELAALPLDWYDIGSSVSTERIDLLSSADVIVVLGFSVQETADFIASDIFKRLPPVAEGRAVIVPQGPVAQAMAIQGPLNFDVLLETAKEVAGAAAKAQ